MTPPSAQPPNEAPIRSPGVAELATGDHHSDRSRHAQGRLSEPDVSKQIRRHFQPYLSRENCGVCDTLRVLQDAGNRRYRHTHGQRSPPAERRAPLGSMGEGRKRRTARRMSSKRLRTSPRSNASSRKPKDWSRSCPTTNRDLMQANQLLRDQSVRDSLTGLYNHSHFQRDTGPTLRVGAPFNAAAVALVHRPRQFQADQRSHTATRWETRSSAKLGWLLDSQQAPGRGMARASDFAARYGGEEFALDSARHLDGRRAQRRRTAPQPRDDVDHVTGIDGASTPSVRPHLQHRSRHLSHPRVRSLRSRRCRRCGGIRRRGRARIACAWPDQPHLLTSSLAPCTILKPVLQFFDLA